MNKLARVICERIYVLTMALFRRHTLCISRKSDEVRAQFSKSKLKPSVAGSILKRKMEAMDMQFSALSGKRNEIAFV